MGMGKSALDALPELRRKGITASGRNFSMGGQILDAPGVAADLRLQVRVGHFLWIVCMSVICTTGTHHM